MFSKRLAVVNYFHANHCWKWFCVWKEVIYLNETDKAIIWTVPGISQFAQHFFTDYDKVRAEQCWQGLTVMTQAHPQAEENQQSVICQWPTIQLYKFLYSQCFFIALISSVVPVFSSVHSRSWSLLNHDCLAQLTHIICYQWNYKRSGRKTGDAFVILRWLCLSLFMAPRAEPSSF